LIPVDTNPPLPSRARFSLRFFLFFFAFSLLFSTCAIFFPSWFFKTFETYAPFPPSDDVLSDKKCVLLPPPSVFLFFLCSGSPLSRRRSTFLATNNLAGLPQLECPPPPFSSVGTIFPFPPPQGRTYAFLLFFLPQLPPPPCSRVSGHGPSVLFVNPEFFTPPLSFFTFCVSFSFPPPPQPDSTPEVCFIS